VRGEPLSLDAVFELHRIATEGTLEQPDQAGRLRTAADAAVVVEDRRTQEAVHVPPRVDQLDSRLRELIAFANGDRSTSNVFIHPLVRAIALHFMIGWIHPFIDGNGRTAPAPFAETRRSRALLEGNGTLRTRLNLRQSLLLQNALDHPHDTITIATHMAGHQVTHQTARKDLVDLTEEFQLLDRHVEGRRFVFTAPADLAERMARYR